MKGMTRDIPADCVLIQAKLTRTGDTMRFRNSRYDYVISEADISPIGMVRHRHGDELMVSSYRPNELVWITKRHIAE